jgi:Uma2 family endonuclease
LLLIEVSESTLRYDLETKARLYATHRVPEYWVVDLVNCRIVRHRAPRRAEYGQCDDVASGAVPLPTSGAEISLAGLF